MDIEWELTPKVTIHNTIFGVEVTDTQFGEWFEGNYNGLQIHEVTHRGQLKASIV